MEQDFQALKEQSSLSRGRDGRFAGSRQDPIPAFLYVPGGRRLEVIQSPENGKPSMFGRQGHTGQVDGMNHENGTEFEGELWTRFHVLDAGEKQTNRAVLSLLVCKSLLNTVVSGNSITD